MSKWVPVSKIDIPPVENTGFKEKIIIRTPVAPEIAAEKPKTSFEMLDEMNFNSADDETIILGSGDDEPTMVLKKSYAYVKRLKTNELIMIDQDEFILGKGTKADYIISGNSAISRNHALIYQKNDEYYLKDLNSSNHTYLDDQLVQDVVKLQDGMEFKMADEMFKFILIEES